jgi:hypothetical protein
MNMQQRAGLLFLAKATGRIFLIYEHQKWTVPTFVRNVALLEDVNHVLETYSIGKILPIELYLSEDRGFEYGTYVCLVEKEFLTSKNLTISWAALENLPKDLHNGLKRTLNNSIIKNKISTILQLNLCYQ